MHRNVVEVVEGYGIEVNSDGSMKSIFNDCVVDHVGSVALGVESQAIGECSFAWGEACVATGEAAVAMGALCVAEGNDSFAIGTNSTAGGNGAIAMGQGNSVYGESACAIGNSNTADGDYCFSAGSNNYLTAKACAVLGTQNFQDYNEHSPIDNCTYMQNVEIVNKGFVMFGGLSTTERDALTARNGMVIYNTTTNKFQGYENGSWVNLI